MNTIHQLVPSLIMKIQETIERDCCQSRDLKPLPGSAKIGMDWKYKFCIYCGRHHEYTYYNDGVDSNSRAYIPMLWPWETK